MIMMSGNPMAHTHHRLQNCMNIQISRMLTLHMKARRFSFLPHDVVSEVTRNSVALPVSASRVLPVAMSSSPL